MSLSTKINKLPDSEYEITAELPAEEFSAYRAKAIRSIGNVTEIDGFRKGKAPEKMLIERVGEMTVLEEMASEAISHEYPGIIDEHKLDVIGRPEITILTLAPSNALSFKMRVAVAPEFSLPDYKKIARKIAEKPITQPEVKDEEIDAVIKEIATRRTPKAKEGEKTMEPTINDEFAKSIGNFSSLNDLKEKIRGNIMLEKSEHERQKRRAEIMDGLVSATSIPLPKVIVDRECDQMLSEAKYNIESMGLNFADYLAHTKKTEADFRKENEPKAKNRISVKMILKKIADAEKLAPSEDEVQGEVTRLTEYYHDIDEHRAMHYAEDVLRDEKVLAYLESLGKLEEK